MRKRLLYDAAEFLIDQQAFRGERRFLHRHHHLHGFLLGEIDAQALQRRLDRVDAAAFSEHHSRSGLANYIPTIREQLSGTSTAAVLPPARDNTGIAVGE